MIAFPIITGCLMILGVILGLCSVIESETAGGALLSILGTSFCVFSAWWCFTEGLYR
ncbi:hypothetical protein [Streptomyces sp. NPDC096105]|uniref:hypothetical protein n=1 Tax=Streptomyces sp. NPDC096105 TaxID=3366074 RepID=UPI00380EBD67